MAVLEVMQSPGLVSAGWTVTSTHPAAVAAVPDAIVQHLGLQNDAFSCWALHPHEQDGLRDTAYVEERRELGATTQVEVVELVRPHQQRVVWLDRFHLVAVGAPAAVASRIAGLYVASPGMLVGSVHDRTGTMQVMPQLTAIPDQARKEGSVGRATAQLGGASRFAFGIDGRAGTHMNLRPDQMRQPALQLQCPAVYAGGVSEALARLQQLVVNW